jgi:hypothetical protein
MSIEIVMNRMQPDWKYRWCESNACGCMGCANRSGGLNVLGYSKEDWEEWVSKNPKPAIKTNVKFTWDDNYGKK